MNLRKRLATSDNEKVQNLIERCIELYMSQKEIVDTLQKQAKIEPEDTEHGAGVRCGGSASEYGRGIRLCELASMVFPVLGGPERSRPGVFFESHRFRIGAGDKLSRTDGIIGEAIFISPSEQQNPRDSW